ncbi:DUF1553 domain-containing protein [Stieleria marina]|uniref:Planctomycete cytochrome C n=1 Tax=Stieleria marina TaxID=1930275 RepID=A0A517NMX5_9BACT|nr:Planctomycete cytochrome C [Planctomycetes bacterium K23_9]
MVLSLIGNRILETRSRSKLLLTVATWMAGICLHSVSATAEAPVDFNRDIRSLLSNNCLMCHGPDEEERAAGLRLDTQEGSREDLGGYAAVVPGDPDESELLLRIISDDEDVQMPPQGKGRPLTDDEVNLVRRWIQQGGDYAKHWAYQKPVRPALPCVKQNDWPRNAIDYFVLAKLESTGQQPSPEAGRLAIARRVALDLTGLPPTWKQAQAFATDRSETAYESYVDQLLAQQSFGERWGRVWLDLARYADSAGYADDPPRTIWAFRDYVIRSLNENKPFDQFTIEQIAGDLLDDPTEQQLVATAFHRNTLTNNEGGTNDEEFRNAAVADRVNTTMAVWMGTTMACAQCHTHKYDPITHEDYFRFFAFFNQSQDADIKNERPTVDLWSDDQKKRKQELRDDIKSITARLNRPSGLVDADRARWLAEVQTRPVWTTATPQSVESKHRKLVIDEDGQISTSGERPTTDTFQVEIKTSGEPLSAIQIAVPPAQKESFVITHVQASWSPLNEENEKVSARFVRVELPGKNKFLHLAEIQAFSNGRNVAVDGDAIQSSTAFGGQADRVNDGTTDGDFKKSSVTHTESQTTPWVEVDLKETHPLQRIVVFNRTDGGVAIRNRLNGYHIKLLDESRKIVWEQSPDQVPDPSVAFSLTGPRDVPMSAAFADFSQKGFPAAAAIDDKMSPKSGWAVSPRTGQVHELTLVTAKPIDFGDGLLTIDIEQESEHQRHVLNHFSIRTTASKGIATWAQMPKRIGDLIASDPENWTNRQRSMVSDYHRSVSPILAGERAKLKRIEQDLAALKPYTTIPVMKDLADESRRVTKIQIRGNYLSTGDEVTEGTPAAFHPLRHDAASGRVDPNRLALANWLVDDDNALTARVIANRHWEQLFGTGIVATSEDFGSQGELPSHPELLDWLAVNLRDNDWDIKRFIKLIVTSATYRQSSVTNQAAITADPFNRLFSRGPRFRISAEMVRDQALFVSGLLSDKKYGPPVNPPQPELGLKAAFGGATDWKTSRGDDKYRRGIYTTWRRSSPYPSMAQFDAPNREVCTVRRIRTNTPLQALVTLNDPVYIEAAQALARRMIAASDVPAQRIQHGIRRSLIRDATDAEITRLAQLADESKKHFQKHESKALPMATEPLGELPDDANVADFAAWTVVANVILNLDEIFMKR